MWGGVGSSNMHTRMRPMPFCSNDNLDTGIDYTCNTNINMKHEWSKNIIHVL